jgi:hypothetical protein
MSHKKSNEELRGQRLAVELSTALDSAAWQSEEDRQQDWGHPKRSSDDDFDLTKLIEEQLRK